MKRSRRVAQAAMLFVAIAMIGTGAAFLLAGSHAQYVAVLGAGRGVRVAACKPGITALAAGGTSWSQTPANTRPIGDAGSLWGQADSACFPRVRDQFAAGAVLLLVGLGAAEKWRRTPGRARPVRRHSLVRGLTS